MVNQIWLFGKMVILEYLMKFIRVVLFGYDNISK